MNKFLNRFLSSFLAIFALNFALIFSASAQAASPERAGIESREIRRFLAETRAQYVAALLHIPRLHCKANEKLISGCFRDFSEVKDFYISLEHKQAALRMSLPHRLFSVIGCLKDEGFNAKIILLKNSN